MSQLRYKRVEKTAKALIRGTSKSAGADLSSLHDYTIPPKGKVIVDTGIIVELPENTFGLIKGRSSFEAKEPLHVGAGVIDEDYRGRIKVILFNLSNHVCTIEAGERIAQLMVIPLFYPELVEMQEEEVPTFTERNDGGFGSTGAK